MITLDAESQNIKCLRTVWLLKLTLLKRRVEPVSMIADVFKLVGSVKDTVDIEIVQLVTLRKGAELEGRIKKSVAVLLLEPYILRKSS